MKRTPPFFGTIVFASSILLVAILAALVFQNRQRIFGTGSSTEGQTTQPTSAAPTPVATPTLTTTEMPTPTLTAEPDKPETGTNGLGESNIEGSITITRAAVENQILVVRTILTGTEPGTCSMIVGLSDGGFYTSETVETTPFSGNSACNGFDIPFSEFLPADGVSDVEVRYQNAQGQTLTTGPQPI